MRTVSIPRLLRSCAGWLAVLVGSFLVLEALALRFSSDARIAAHLQSAFAQGVLPTGEQGMSPYGDTGHRYDDFTECLALSTNLGNENEPLLYRLAATPHYSVPKEAPCESLQAGLRAGSVAANREYFRYWHGAQIYLRPLLSLMPLAALHRLNALVLIAALALLMHRLVAWFGILAAPAFLVPFAFGSDLLTVPAVSVHALLLAWVFGSAAIFGFVLERRLLTGTARLTIAFCLGAITNFFDVLFNPPLAPALFAFLVLFWEMSGKHGKPAIGRAIAHAAGIVAVWFTGYALAWVAKWTFSAAILGVHKVAADIAHQIAFKIDGAIPDAPLGSIAFFTPTYLVLAQVGFPLILTCVGLAVIALAARCLIHGTTARADLAYFSVLQLPLLVPGLWGQIVRNHTIIHAGFVSRSFVLVAVLPLLGALAVWRRPVLPQ